MDSAQVLDAVKGDIKEFADGAKARIEQQDERLLQIERAMSKGSGSWAGGSIEKSLGDAVIESEQIKSFYDKRLDRSGKVLEVVS